MRWLDLVGILLATVVMVVLSSVAIDHLLRPFDADVSDDGLGVMWSAIAAVFVYRTSFRASWRPATTRVVATLAAVMITLVYLLVLNQTLAGDAIAIALAAAVPAAVGHGEDSTTAAITAIVIVEVARLSVDQPWTQPVLRLVDTAIGVVIGLVVAAADAGVRVAFQSRKAGVR